MEFAISLLESIIPGIIVGVVMATWNKQQKKRDSEHDKKEIERIEGESVKLSLLLSASQLSYACAICLRDGKNNGEMKTAIESYNSAINNFRKFEREQLIKKECSYEK